MTAARALAWQCVTAHSKEGEQEVMNADPVSARVAAVSEGHSWQVKVFVGPARRANPMNLWGAERSSCAVAEVQHPLPL